jgi:hypothetical protein
MALGAFIMLIGILVGAALTNVSNRKDDDSE